MINEIKIKKLIWKKWWVWVIAVFVIIIIASAGGDEKKEIQPEQQLPQEQTQSTQEKHFISFNVSLKDRNLVVNGNTNIPNNSVLTISINRYIEYTGLEGKRVTMLNDGKTTIKNGKFTYSTYLTDKEWYEKESKENKILGIDFKKIYEDCYVLVTFTPKVGQSKEVYEILGKNFEKLNIEGEPGSFKSIQVAKEFKLPIEEGITLSGIQQQPKQQSQPEVQQPEVQQPEVQQPEPEPEPTWHTIATFSGKSAKKTQPLSITGQQWRIKWDCKLTGEFDTGSLQVWATPITDEYGDLMVNTSNCPESDTSYLYEGQKTYYLDISSLFTNWTIVVEDLY